MPRAQAERELEETRAAVDRDELAAAREERIHDQHVEDLVLTEKSVVVFRIDVIGSRRGRTRFARCILGQNRLSKNNAGRWKRRS